jgi:biopolymer transport protein ExbD
MLSKKRRIGITIDMTPMVDIAFLLLIFFMCTTEFEEQEKDKIALPSSSSEAKAPEANTITVNVTSEPGVRLRYRTQGKTVEYPIAAEAIPLELGPALMQARAAQPGAFVIIRMDKDAPYGVMADMMAALQQAKATRFNVQTELEVQAGRGQFQR